MRHQFTFTLGLPAAVIFKKLVNRTKIKVAEFNMPLNLTKNWELDRNDMNCVFFVEMYLNLLICVMLLKLISTNLDLNGIKT